MNVTSHPAKPEKSGAKRVRAIYYAGMAVFALFIMLKSILFSYGDIMYGVQNISVFNKLNWAHDKLLLEQMTKLFVLIWLVATSLFVGGWLLRRSIRKLSGKDWLLPAKKEGRRRFFPPVLLYLKLSCLYLVVVALYLYSQYPLQFILTPA